MYKVEFANSAAKVLESVSKNDRGLYQRLSAAVDVIAQDPFQGKVLRAPFEGSRSYRVGNYRILYTIYKHRLVVYIFDLGHRREICR